MSTTPSHGSREVPLDCGQFVTHFCDQSTVNSSFNIISAGANLGENGRKYDLNYFVKSN